MKIGIIANPASGKDIRRLVSYATVIDNNEKVNIVKRAVLAAQEIGVQDIYVMPDSFQMGVAVRETLALEKVLKTNIHLLKMSMTSTGNDTVRAAAMLEELQVECVIVLGGDGTSRAAAKSLKEVPLLPISTGTNNVYPDLVEGTIAGLAAGLVGRLGRAVCCKRDKRIEIYTEDDLVDIALVDVAFSNDDFVGARAIWDSKKIKKVAAVRAHPANIGFSSLVGCRQIVRPEDDFGAVISVDPQGTPTLVPIGAGVVERIGLGEPEVLPLGASIWYTAKEPTMLALDGEREIFLPKGKTAQLRITRNGPWRLDVQATMEAAKKNGFFMQI